MSSPPTFEQYAEKGRSWVREVAEELSIPEEKAHRIMRVVLHALRKRIPLEESFHLIAQLPIIWKGIYVDGWKPGTKFERLKGLDEYLMSVREEDKGMAGYDFGNDQQAKKAIYAVWKLLANHISEKEIVQICNTLPSEISDEIKKKLTITIL